VRRGRAQSRSGPGACFCACRAVARGAADARGPGPISAP